MVLAFCFNFRQFVPCLFQIWVCIITNGRFFTCKQKKERWYRRERLWFVWMKGMQTKGKITYWGKNRGEVTLFCSDQLFYITNTFTQLWSSLINTFSPIKYWHLWRYYNFTYTIMPHYLIAIRRSSSWDKTVIYFWSKIFENACHRVHFQLRCWFPACKILKKEKICS